MPLAHWKDLCVDATDARVTARFWDRALGGGRIEHQDNGDAALHGEVPEQTVWINQVPEPKTVKNRVHLDLLLPSVEPLLDAGAVVMRDVDDGEVRWRVLADPEGNELCVFAPGDGEPSALVVDAAKPEDIAAWWADVLGATLRPGPDGRLRWLSEVPGLPFDVIKFVPVPEPKVVKNRWHWDVSCDDEPELVARGARVLRQPDDEVRWHVLADPEGNEFCAFTS